MSILFEFKIKVGRNPNLSCIIVDMKNTFKLRICPYCGHHGQKLVSSTFEGLHKEDEGSPCVKVSRTTYQVECQCCGAKGPIEFKVEEALWSWNLRHTRPAHDDDQEKIEFIYETESEKE